jgi:hypothetical protein
MGSCNFSTISFGKNAHDAYTKACDKAQEYYGHQEGYNGTISTTNGFSLLPSAPKYGTKIFQKFEEKTLDVLSKRSCRCVEIKGSKAKELKERNGLKGTRQKPFYFFGWAAE